MSKKSIYSFFVEWGRMGELEGVFLEEPKVVAHMLMEGPSLYFGEVLGKHSEVVVDLESSHISLLSDDQNAVNVLADIFGDTISGFNPVKYWEDQKDE